MTSSLLKSIQEHLDELQSSFPTRAERLLRDVLREANAEKPRETPLPMELRGWIHSFDTPPPMDTLVLGYWCVKHGKEMASGKFALCMTASPQTMFYQYHGSKDDALESIKDDKDFILEERFELSTISIDPDDAYNLEWTEESDPPTYWQHFPRTLWTAELEKAMKELDIMQ